MNNIKTCSGLLAHLKGQRIDHIMTSSYRVEYYITVGTLESNALIRVNLHERRIDTCERTHNGTNYDLGREATYYVTKAGANKLIDFIHAYLDNQNR